MLRITVTEQEYFNSETNKFVVVPDTVLELEHSLVAISKWEAIYEVTFLSDTKKTTEQVLTYVRCMSLSEDVANETLTSLSSDNLQKIQEYIVSKQTATRLMKAPSSAPSREKVTSDLIYYWMIALQIPWEAQYWHIERLLTLIEICQRKNQASNKGMSRGDMAKHRRSVNAQRRRQYGISG